MQHEMNQQQQRTRWSECDREEHRIYGREIVAGQGHVSQIFLQAGKVKTTINEPNQTCTAGQLQKMSISVTRADNMECRCESTARCISLKPSCV